MHEPTPGRSWTASLELAIAYSRPPARRGWSVQVKASCCQPNEGNTIGNMKAARIDSYRRRWTAGTCQNEALQTFSYCRTRSRPASPGAVPYTESLADDGADSTYKTGAVPSMETAANTISEIGARGQVRAEQDRASPRQCVFRSKEGSFLNRSSGWCWTKKVKVQYCRVVEGERAPGNLPHSGSIGGNGTSPESRLDPPPGCAGNLFSG